VDKARAPLAWNELNIEETSKDRGTRMKINEPDTPYNYDYVSSSSDDENEENGTTLPKPAPKEENVVSTNWEAINTKLETAQKKQDSGVDLVAIPIDESVLLVEPLLIAKKKKTNSCKKGRPITTKERSGKN